MVSKELVGALPDRKPARATRPQLRQLPQHRHGRPRPKVDHGALEGSTETSRRLASDASLVRMHHDAEGGILEVGRKTRTIPPSIRRALAARDTLCRFPGCISRRCDVHHVEHSTPARTPRTAGAPVLGRRRGHESRQPGAAVPASSSRRARGRIRCGPPSRWDDHVPARRHAARRRAGAATMAAGVARGAPADPRDTTDVGWHATRHPSTQLQCTCRRVLSDASSGALAAVPL
jgi:hypothetical protein